MISLHRYWDQSIVPLPAVDIRSAYDKHQGASITYTRRLLVTTLYHTWSYTGFALVLLIVAIYCIAGTITFRIPRKNHYNIHSALYTQLFSSYSNGCVNHSANNTYFSAALAPIAYNFAASSGNAYLASAMAKYNVNASSTCGLYQANYADSFGVSTGQVSASGSSFASKSQAFLLLADCLDSSAMDDAFATACATPLNATLYCPVNATSLQPYGPPSTYLSNTTCLPSAFPEGLSSQLQPSAFNCTVLPKCQVQYIEITSSLLNRNYLHIRSSVMARMLKP